MSQDQLDLRQEKAYRRGLILGLTMAEIMILLLFVLLMALASSLQNRDVRIKALADGGAARLMEELQRAYPQARSSDDYFKELVRAVEARKQIESAGVGAGKQTFLADAEVGRRVREAAATSGVKDTDKFVNEVVAASAKGRKGQWPPFLSLSEAGGYYFDSGKATLRPEFERNLRSQVIPTLSKYVADYDVDVIEVIGHTDEVPMSGESNLDGSLIQASVGRVPIGSLRSTDNSGLAMARAVAVAQQLRGDARLRNVTILPLSGAQMIVPVDKNADGSARGSDQRRRRIEIRLRKSTAQAVPTKAAG